MHKLLLFLLLLPVAAFAQSGAVVGTPTFGAAKFGNGLTVVSDTNYVTLPSGVVPATTTPPFAVEAWINTTSSAAGPFVALAIGNGATGSQVWLGIASGKATATFFGIQISSTGLINDGTWHHLAISGSGSTGQFYLDGALVTTFSGVVTPQTFTVTSGYVGRYFSVGYPFPGGVDEVATWSINKYTAAFTPPAAAYTGSETSLISLFHLQTDATNSVAAAALSIGSITVAASPSGVAISMSTGLAGGSGAGYVYNIYRGVTPNFTANVGSLLASPTTVPYTDSTAVQGTFYYYGVQGADNASHTVNANPAGVGSWAPAYIPYVAIQVPVGAINVCFIGDSITYGAGGANPGTMLSPAMPYFAANRLSSLFGTRNVFGSNQGKNGASTTDWLPATATYYPAAKTAMNTLITANPTALQVFSIMLGTNDSASSGTNNGGIGASLPATTFKTNLITIGTQLMTDFPNAKVIIHDSPYYSPNTQNTAVYLQAGLVFLNSYRASTVSAVAALAASYPGHFYLGDISSYGYFASTYASEMQADVSGPNGTFYLHPLGTLGSGGFIGEQTLGIMHAQAIANALFGSGVLPYTYF